MKIQIEIIGEDVVYIYHYSHKEVDNSLSYLWQRVICSKYKVIKHSPHSPVGQYHIHVYEGKNSKIERLAINKDGTAHDNSHGARIPNRVFEYLKNVLPDWNWPKDQVIPFLSTNSSNKLPATIEYKDGELLTIGRFYGFVDIESFNSEDKTCILNKAIVETEKGVFRLIDVKSIVRFNE